MLLAACLSLAFQTSPGSSALPVPRPLSAEAAREDLALLRAAFVRIHPGLGRYEPEAEFLRACDVLHDSLEGGTTDLDLTLRLSLLTARVRCGHTRVEAPAWLDAQRARTAMLLPFRFRLFEARMFVEHVPAGSPLARGAEILAIDGRATGELVEALAATVPVDGWTDSIRPSRLEAAYEFRESGFDHYLPLLR